MNNRMNFSGGPGALPASVLQQTREAIAALPETGISVLGMSHRSDWFRSVLDEAEQNLRSLLNIPDNYRVLFLQGGSSLQFSMLPMNFLRGHAVGADYLVTGYWSAKAPIEAQLEGRTHVVWDGRANGFKRLPEPAEPPFTPGAAYLHYVSNETVEGLEFAHIPGRVDVPLVCDMSSNLLGGPLDVSCYAMIYAHAQKNLGPSGVTLVIMRDDFAAQAATGLPTVLDYRTHVQYHSNYNTPPVFAIYVLMLVTRWLRDDIGGLQAMAALNRLKSEQVYAALDAHPDIYLPHAEAASRSRMNVVFSLRHGVSDADFAAAARQAGIHGLEGHRSLGGWRASLYNAIALDEAQDLADWLRQFALSQAQS
ncbi:MAG: 3-phosphoserine/phosphohydroxythreonine transaminase [Burkholderiaceae bacterium]|nr:3-phosphoserine/phosphohydroxythreonine transaminase [Roseateles sp.]MBV8471110.1 3-phosphoserine/phosphohydroxythreonine transaminase [Burkholderiaceae bacterium]